jgi:hypothetical protein
MKKDKPTKKTPAAKKPKRHAAPPVDQPMVAATPAPSATAAVPPPPPEAPPARIEAPSRIEVIEVPRPEDALPAGELLAALRFVLPAAAPKGDLREVIFTSDEGHHIIAARSRDRLHVAYVRKAADWKVYGAVQPEAARKLSKLLAGVEDDDEATVVATSSGRITIRRLGQPALPHELDVTPAPLVWMPPPDGRESTAMPLLLSADHLVKAVRYPGGTVEIEQRTSARAILTVTVDGALVARAILAERGHELYPSPPEPPPPPPAQPPLRGLREEDLPTPRPRKTPPSAPAAVAAPRSAANDVAPTDERDASPTDERAATSSNFPTPKDDVNVVLSLSAAAVATLEARGTLTFLRTLSFLSLADVGNGERASGPLTPAEVAAVAAILAGDGLRCVEVVAAEHDEAEACEEWRVDVAGEPKGAAV